MALTPTEIELIKALSRRQDQLELMIGSAIGGLPGRGLVMLDQELGRRNFLLNRSNEESNLFVILIRVIRFSLNNTVDIHDRT